MSARLDEFYKTPPSDREYLQLVPDLPVWQKAMEVAGWVVVPVVKAGLVAYDLIQKAGLPNVASVPPELAAELKFPQGAPAEQVLFRRHPYDELRYLRVADYNPYVFKDKTVELARLMIAAGATKFELTADSASTSEMVMDASAGVEAAVKGSLRAAHKDATKVIWTYSGTGLTDRVLPDSLVWFKQRPEWQTIWTSATEHGAKSHSLEIRQDTSHELDGKLATKFGGAGFNIGGTFREAASCHLKILVEFR